MSVYSKIENLYNDSLKNFYAYGWSSDRLITPKGNDFLSIKITDKLIMVDYFGKNILCLDTLSKNIFSIDNSNQGNRLVNKYLLEIVDKHKNV